MPLYVHFKTSNAMTRRIASIRAAAKPGSRTNTRVLGDIRRLVIEDNTDKLLGYGLLEGIDRYGKRLAPLAPSTFRDKRRGFGPVLAPRGLASRFITNFEAVWYRVSGGASVLTMRFRDIVDAKGRSFAQYHLDGCPRGSNPKRPNWSLPRRDVGGVSPRGWKKIDARHKKFAAEVLKGE